MLTHVAVRNYKSLANVEVDLGPLTVLVGPNGTGKSNFVDALRFVSDALSTRLDQAIIDRGGIDSIRRYSRTGRPSRIYFHLSFRFGSEIGEYYLEFTGKGNEYNIKTEKCEIDGIGFTVRDGQFQTDDPDLKNTSLDTTRLLLPFFGEELAISKIKNFLTEASYYSIYPNTLREPRKPSFSYKLMEEGYNLGSVLRRLQKEMPQRFGELTNTLGRVVPGVTGLDIQLVGGYLVVKLIYQHDEHISVFDLSQESDGTLRLLGILTALYQEPVPTYITIEEPELTVHPGALYTLNEIIKETSLRSQILITTHSPDLISLAEPSSLRVVEKVHGSTEISPLDERQIDIINDKLFSTSDLLRIEGLRGRQSD